MRKIEFLRDRHVPDMLRCGADDTVEGEVVRCVQFASIAVRVDGQENVVCHHHFALLIREKYPVVPKAGTEEQWQTRK